MKIFLLSLLLLLITLPEITAASTHEFALIPLMHEGRVKPLGTLADLKLKKIYGKNKLDQLTATDWMVELFFNPKVAYSREIFRIMNNDVKAALKLDSSRKYFTFIEIYTAIHNHQQLMNDILSSKEANLDLTSSQLKELYGNFTDYLGLSRTFSFFSPEMKLDDTHALSLYEIIHSNIPVPAKALTEFKNFMEEDAQFKSLNIIPPRGADNELWTMPWESMQTNNFPILEKWSDLYSSYNKTSDEFEVAARKLQNPELLPKFRAELFIKKFNLVHYAIFFYVTSFLLLSLSFLKPIKMLRVLSFSSVAIGGLLHLVFIGIRCFVLSRPPVTNLYESILFVGLTSVLFALIYEWKKKNSLGLFISSTLGTTLLFLSIGYQGTEDNLGMLVAVLDTNFWLATHVVTISIGYGCALVASLMAHFYLLKLKDVKAEESRTLLKNLHGTILFSLFFVILGTILGGIWADQSWGRFWGWDPKENGALLICLWLLWITHGKLAGKFKNASFAFFSGLTSIVVAMAWFGVNLLNVGLHSYGFSNDAARGLFLFSFAELLILSLLFFKSKRLQNKKALQ